VKNALIFLISVACYW